MLPGGTLHPVFKEYNIIGGGYRKNAVCPRCYCTDRDRLVFLYLKNHSDILGSSRSLLHIAPEGALRALFMKEKNLDYITGFKNADAYKGYYYQQSEQNIDITSIPFPDERFDMIICNQIGRASCRERV